MRHFPTLPVSVASCERILRKLKLIKTNLRPVQWNNRDFADAVDALAEKKKARKSYLKKQFFT